MSRPNLRLVNSEASNERSRGPLRKRDALVLVGSGLTGLFLIYGYTVSKFPNIEQEAFLVIALFGLYCVSRVITQTE